MFRDSHWHHTIWWIYGPWEQRCHLHQSMNRMVFQFSFSILDSVYSHRSNKESSIELLQIVTDPRRELLKTRFQHSIFGSFSASRALKCSFSDSETRTSTDVDMDSKNDYEYPDFDIPFTSQSRSTHDHILGNDILVSLLENGNLVFWTVTTSNGNLEETGRLEPLIKV